MDKHFISANQLLADSFRLGRTIHQQGFKPQFIVGVWRGGAPVGIAVQEYLAYQGVLCDHIAIRTSSYYGVDRAHKEVRVQGMDYLVSNVQADQALLIVDDVFDSGRSIDAIIRTLSEQVGDRLPATIKVACPWYKPERNTTERIPDFYLHTTNQWLVFPHELLGHTREEIAAGKGNEIADLL